MDRSARDPRDLPPANAGLRGRRVLIVGATREADALARLLAAEGAAAARVAPEAARAAASAAPGALALVDACHPFDAAGAAAARAAARAGGVPYAALRRRPWFPGPGDRWLRVRSPAAAARALAPEWRRVFLALGRDRLAPFRGQTGRLLLVRAPGRAAAPKGAAAPPGLARAVFLADPGPYDAAGEARLFRRLRVDAVVARNAGGPEAWPKMAAARRLGLPVVLLDPPSRPSGALDDPAAALARLRALAGTEPALALPRRDA